VIDATSVVMGDQVNLGKDLLNEYADKLWVCSAIYWDKDGKRLGWFPIPDGSSYAQRDAVAQENGIRDWHIHAIFHAHRLGNGKVGYAGWEKGPSRVSFPVDPISGKRIED